MLIIWLFLVPAVIGIGAVTLLTLNFLILLLFPIIFSYFNLWSLPFMLPIVLSSLGRQGERVVGGRSEQAVCDFSGSTKLKNNHSQTITMRKNTLEEPYCLHGNIWPSQSFDLILNEIVEKTNFSWSAWKPRTRKVLFNRDTLCFFIYNEGVKYFFHHG